MLALPMLITNVLSEPEHGSSPIPCKQHSSTSTYYCHIALSKLVAAMLSCFHGPQVEGSFFMSSIMNAATTRMNVNTFIIIQTVKYSIMGSNKIAIQYFTSRTAWTSEWSPHSQHEWCIQKVLYSSCWGKKGGGGGEENWVEHVSVKKAATKRKAKEATELATKKTRMVQ